MNWLLALAIILGLVIFLGGNYLAVRVRRADETRRLSTVKAPWPEPFTDNGDRS